MIFFLQLRLSRWLISFLARALAEQHSNKRAKNFNLKMKKHRLFSNGVNKLKSIEELLIVPVWESEWIVIVVVVAAGALRCLWYIFLELRQHIISRISLTEWIEFPHQYFSGRLGASGHIALIFVEVNVNSTQHKPVPNGMRPSHVWLSWAEELMTFVYFWRLIIIRSALSSVLCCCCEAEVLLLYRHRVVLDV